MRLIVHIGNGKTGTTSIQNSLDRFNDELTKSGVRYLGRMLENAPSETPKDWQTPDGAELLLHQMPADQVCADLAEVLLDCLDRLKEAEINTAVWSNEALFARHFGVIDALKTVQDHGVEVRIVLYLRRHDKWAKSAYAQWGIRHKSYQGGIKSFAEWVAERPVRFAPNLETWNAAFKEKLDLRNFDEIADVSADFFEILGLRDLDHSRVYQTPSLEQLTAHAIFNNGFPGVVYPDRFGALMRSNAVADLNKSTSDRLQNLLPKTAELEKLLEDCAEDRRIVDAVFAEKHQPQFSEIPAKTGDITPDIWAFVVHLMTMNFDLLDRIGQLERRLNELERR